MKGSDALPVKSHSGYWCATTGLAEVQGWSGQVTMKWKTITRSTCTLWLYTVFQKKFTLLLFAIT